MVFTHLSIVQKGNERLSNQTTQQEKKKTIKIKGKKTKIGGRKKDNTQQTQQVPQTQQTQQTQQTVQTPQRPTTQTPVKQNPQTGEKRAKEPKLTKEKI